MRALALLLIAPTCRGGLEQQRAAQQRGGVGARRSPPAVGAIRWDAYFSQPGEAVFDDPNAGIVTRTTTFDMSPKEWHYRVPFFGAELNDTAIIANGNSAAVMAQELEYAAQSGINFWAFCNYPIGCKDYHPPPESCAGIQCCADNVALSCEHPQPLSQGRPVRASADRVCGHQTPGTCTRATRTSTRSTSHCCSSLATGSTARRLAPTRPGLRSAPKRFMLPARRDKTVVPALTGINGRRCRSCSATCPTSRSPTTRRWPSRGASRGRW